MILKDQLVYPSDTTSDFIHCTMYIKRPSNKQNIQWRGEGRGDIGGNYPPPPRKKGENSRNV